MSYCFTRRCDPAPLTPFLTRRTMTGSVDPQEYRSQAPMSEPETVRVRRGQPRGKGSGELKVQKCQPKQKAAAGTGVEPRGSVCVPRRQNVRLGRFVLGGLRV